ncbi:hypothetical protein AQI70_16035 [Streptomyces curacoi]|uniref:ABC transporter ATP-binding protein n=2 Tax=Streptomyces curacoi TaxID=146536 RepID=A0A117PAH2_9ACTN|nr:hypothetical protein AQI70_16035 [Streptomyces curacoi]
MSPELAATHGPVWKEVTTDRGALCRLAGWSALSVLPVLVQGHMIRLASDRGFLAGTPRDGVAYLVLAMAAFVLGALATRHTLRSLTQIVEPLRDRLMRRVITAEIHGAVDSPHRTGSSAVARLAGQIEVVRDLVGGLLASALSLVFTTVAATLGLLALHPLLAALIIVPVLAALALVTALVPVLYSRQRKVLYAEEEVAAITTWAVEGTRDAIACGAEDRVAADVLDAVERQADCERALARAQALRTAAVAIGLHLPPLLLIAAAGSLTGHGITAGALLGAGAYILSGIAPALRQFVSAVGSSGLKLAVVMQKVAAAGSRPASRAHGTKPPQAPRGSDLELRDVSFGYGPHARVIDALSLRLEPGSRLAVVGPSGVGKSTLADLITGALTPDTGHVLLGGVPVNTLSGQARRDHIAVVPQDAYVFAGTLRDNLTYLAPHTTDHDLDTALSRFRLGPLAERLGGNDTPFDPNSLSAGERQLIALARADLQAAPVIVLDEATSALDADAEARAEQAVYARGGTVVVIAHRISSAMRADAILVLDAERADIGTHDELLKRSPLYADLVGHWHGTTTPPDHKPTPVTL